jgi:5-formyltetrahydrofolate cyclo-ligase
MEKAAIRRVALDRRAAQANKDTLSRRIVETLVALPEFTAAAAVAIYLDARTEVRTRRSLPKLLASGKRIVVPWCDQDELRLFALESPDELATGRFGILEPQSELRHQVERQVSPAEIDLFVIPGVAFDRRGTRLGHGRGYFDRLLARARQDAKLVGLAFECQLFDTLPSETHDIRMHQIITENGVLSLA